MSALMNETKDKKPTDEKEKMSTGGEKDRQLTKEQVSKLHIANADKELRLIAPTDTLLKSKAGRKLVLPIIALGLDVVAPFLFLALGQLSWMSGIFVFVSIMGVILSPIAGIVLGGVALNFSGIGKSGVAVSIVAIALPIVFVLVMILLFVTGNVYIGM